MQKKIKDTILHPDQETIIAQCTPKGSGAIALLRMTGINAFTVATKLSKLSSGQNLSNMPSHTIQYGWVVDANKKNIDQVLFLIMQAPKTFTGQDTVEITCHNNPFIIQDIINIAITHGARVAKPGEFTKRAFLSNKLDLVQAEAINELIHAQTQMALKSSLSQLEGSLSDWATKLEKELVRALALSEASFEFIDEEHMEFGKQIQGILKAVIKNITTAKKTFDQQTQIRQGIRIAIIGSVNAGKSSLFNTLLNQKRAIVTSIAGTTRDSIEAGITQESNFITLVDTAGLRQTDNIIEQEGIKRSIDEAKKADLIILIYDGSKKISKEKRKVYTDIIKSSKEKIILVRNKADISSSTKNQLSPLQEIAVSTISNKNIDKLEQIIQNKTTKLFASIESPFLLNKRQYNLILSLEKKLKDIRPMLTEPIEYEIVSYHLKDTLEAFSEFSGKTISEKGLDAIFKEFCIGK